MNTDYFGNFLTADLRG